MPGYASSAMRFLSACTTLGILTPACNNKGAPACNIYATGGFTHFIGEEDPAGISVARWMNLLPTGRASHTALNVSRSSARVMLERCCMS